MKQNNRILYLIHLPPPVHGVSIVCSQVYNSEEINKGFQKHLIKLNLSNKIKQLRQFSIIKVFKFIKIVFQLFITLVVYKPSFVYFSIIPVGKGFLKDSILVFLIKLFSPKIIFHLHNRGINHYYNRPIYRVLYQSVFKNCSIIHLSNKLVEEELGDKFSNQVNLYVCPNSIKGFKKKNTQINSNPVRILFFSNLFPAKGINTMFCAIVRLFEKGVNFYLTIGGTPTKSFHSLVDEYRKSNPELFEYIKIHDSCFDSKKEDLFINSDIFIFPSEFSEECMPLVILEAMSVDLPIIASDIGAINEMIHNNVNGYLISPGDDLNLSLKIECLVKDPKLRKQLGINSGKIFTNSFTQEIQQKKMRDIFMLHANPNKN